MEEPGMEEPEYEYRGLIASSWDLLRGDTTHWDDRPRYRELIERYGQPALDVGCGTGRLLLDYLGAGIDIDGVDNSPEMLARCREKAGRLGLHPVLYQQSIEALALPRRYRTILVPSSSFQLVTDPDAAAAAMRRFLVHLEPGGALAMSFMPLWEAGDPLETEWWVAEQVRPEDGALVRRWSRARYEPARQLEHTEARYEVVRDGEVVAAETHRRSPATRWYTHAQVRDLYDAAGFVGVQLFREWSATPAAADDALVVAVGSKTGHD
jgi:ubiquinone/menaquinone biosynthesis C-methylase UbiE